MKTTAFQQLTQISQQHKKIITAAQKNNATEIVQLIQTYSGELKDEFLIKILSTALTNQSKECVDEILKIVDKKVKFSAAFDGFIFNSPHVFELLKFSNAEKIEFLNEQDSFEQTQFHKLIGMADKATCENIIKNLVQNDIQKQVLFTTTSSGENILHTAFHKNVENIDEFYPFISSKHFTKQEDNTGYAPIHYLYKVSPKLFKSSLEELQKYQIDIHTLNKFQNPLFINLARNNRRDLIEILISSYGKEKVFEPTKSKHLALHSSIAAGHEDTSLYLIEQGFDIWSKNAMDLDALWLSCRFYKKNKQVFDKLLSFLTPEKIKNLNLTLATQDKDNTFEVSSKKSSSPGNEQIYDISENSIFTHTESESKSRNYIAVLAEHAPLWPIKQLLSLGLYESVYPYKTLNSALRSSWVNEKENKIDFFFKRYQKASVLNANLNNAYQNPNSFSYKKRLNDFFLLNLIKNTAASKIVGEIEKYSQTYQITFSSTDWALALCHAINHTNTELFRYIAQNQDLNVLKQEIIALYAKQDADFGSYDRIPLIEFKSSQKIAEFFNNTQNQAYQFILETLNVNAENLHLHKDIIKQLFLYQPSLFFAVFKEIYQKHSDQELLQLDAQNQKNNFASVVMTLATNLTQSEAPQFLRTLASWPSELQEKIITSLSYATLFQVDFTDYLSQSWVGPQEYQKFFQQLITLENKKNLDIDAETQNKNFYFLLNTQHLSTKQLFMAFLATTHKERANELYTRLIQKDLSLIDTKEIHGVERLSTAWQSQQIAHFYEIFKKTKDITPERLSHYITENIKSLLNSSSPRLSPRTIAKTVLEHLSYLPDTPKKNAEILKIYQQATCKLNLECSHGIFEKYQAQNLDLNLHKTTGFDYIDLDNVGKLNFPVILRQLKDHYHLDKEFLIRSLAKSMEQQTNSYTLIQTYQKLSQSFTMKTDMDNYLFEKCPQILVNFFVDARSNDTVLKYMNESKANDIFLGSQEKTKIKILKKICHKISTQEDWGQRLLNHNFEPKIQAFLEKQLLSNFTHSTPPANKKRKIKI